MKVTNQIRSPTCVTPTCLAREDLAEIDLPSIEANASVVSLPSIAVG